jgi:hypothetical protein
MSASVFIFPIVTERKNNKNAKYSEALELYFYLNSRILGQNFALKIETFAAFYCCLSET